MPIPIAHDRQVNIGANEQTTDGVSLKTTWISLGIALTLPVIFIAFGAVGVTLASKDHEVQAKDVMEMAKTIALVTVPVGAILIAYIVSRSRLDHD